MSSPSSVSISSVSRATSAKLMPSLTGRPLTCTDPNTTLEPVTVTSSSRSVPSISTRSASPAGCRLALSSSMSVPRMSPIR